MHRGYWFRGWLLGLMALASGCARVAPTPPVAPEVASGENLARFSEYLWVERLPDSVRVTLRTLGAATGQTITLPLSGGGYRRIVTLSTTHAAMVAHLGADSLLVGLGQTDYLYSPRLRALNLPAVAPGGELDLEALLALRPEVVFLADAQLNPAHTAALARAGVRVLPGVDWLEPHPLGRAEHLLLTAALTGTLDSAVAYLAAVTEAYTALAQRAQAATPKPTVVGGAPYGEVWYQPGGRSYLARLVADAGASYPWAADTSQGSLPLALEVVAEQALTADYWLNPGQMDSQAQLEAAQPRFRPFKPFRTHQLYGYYARRNAQGGNDYFERGVIEPHVVLADLVSIFHPALVPGHRRVYYQHIP